MVVSELELIIAQEVGVLAPKYFGLYEALASGEERCVVFSAKKCILYIYIYNVHS